MTANSTALHGLVNADQFRRNVHSIFRRRLNTLTYLIVRRMLPFTAESSVDRGDQQAYGKRPGKASLQGGVWIESVKIDVVLFGGLLPPVVCLLTQLFVCRAFA